MKKTVIQKAETFQEIGFFGSIKEEKWNEFILAVQNNISHSRKEKENIAFSLYQPENGNLEPIWFERFANKRAHNFHKEQTYFKDAIKVIQKSLKGKASSITLKEVAEIPATVSKNTENPPTAFYSIVLLDIKQEKRQFFINAIAIEIKQQRKVPGNQEFNIYQYSDDPNKFVLLEGWESKATYESKANADYIKKRYAESEDIFVSNPMDKKWMLKDISQ